MVLSRGCNPTLVASPIHFHSFSRLMIPRQFFSHWVEVHCLAVDKPCFWPVRRGFLTELLCIDLLISSDPEQSALQRQTRFPWVGVLVRLLQFHLLLPPLGCDSLLAKLGLTTVLPSCLLLARTESFRRSYSSRSSVVLLMGQAQEGGKSCVARARSSNAWSSGSVWVH